MEIEKMYPYIKAIMFESLSKIPEDRITVIGSEPVISVDLNTLHQINDFIESQQKTIEDMKCCGNCDRENLSMGDYNECPYYYTKNNCLNADHGIDRNYNLKSYWTPKS